MKRLIGVSTLALALAYVFVFAPEKQPPEQVSDIDQVQIVEVQQISPQPMADLITGHGQVSARWNTTLSSEVSGRISEVSEKLLSGTGFQKGDILARVETSSYRSALASAQASLRTAERLFAEEEQRAHIARKSWKKSGLSGDPSKLTLREPQLAEMLSGVESANAAVVLAEYNLAQTAIRAPYDGVVINRSVSPGDYLQSGAQIAQILDNSVFEISIPLSALELDHAADDLIGTKAKLIDNTTRQTWQGQVSRISQQVDAQNRWVNVIISIPDTTGLRSGQFLSAEFPGKLYDAVLAIPADMISRDERLWYVDDNDALQSLSLEERLFSRNGNVFIAAVGPAKDGLKITAPRSSFLPGVKVEIASEPSTELAEVRDE